MELCRTATTGFSRFADGNDPQTVEAEPGRVLLVCEREEPSPTDQNGTEFPLVGSSDGFRHHERVYSIPVGETMFFVVGEFTLRLRANI